MLAALFELVRDLVVLAAGAGIAWWCWDKYRTAPVRRDEAARLQLTAERQAADIRQWTERLETRADGLAEHLATLAAAARASEIRATHKVRVHRLLQSTGDPYLSFAEIEDALGEAPSPSGGTASDEGATAPAGDALRRALMELVSDGVIAQLDKDRYFIASDYEAGSEDAEPAGAA